MTAWLAEDCPAFDWGGFVVGETPRTAHLLAKSSGVLAGVPFFDEVFRQLECSVEWHVAEGQWIDTSKVGKQRVATVKGAVRKLLLGERVALNTLARCSGIATASTLFLKKVRKAGYPGIVAGTRKTTPGGWGVCARGCTKSTFWVLTKVWCHSSTSGFRLVEKYGMVVGGVDMHRYDLSSMVMLKDNHIWSTGS